ncbi:MAG: tetratricopeptide repeat protein [Candidatus Binataceae bacterium]|nr:tetratricopeptide repeat protein [Candidatus Binataceae bacterium]
MQWTEQLSAKPRLTPSSRFTARARLLPAIIAIGVVTTLAAAGCEHKSVDDELAAGDQAMQHTKLADAETDYQQAATMAPSDPRPHVALGNLYVFEQKPAAAESEYMKVLDFEPHNARAHTALGNIYSAQSDLGKAEEQYRAAVALDPTNVAYRINLGGLLQKAGKLGVAEAELRTATGLAPKDAHAHLALANLYSAEPDRGADAATEFAAVKELDPSLMPGAASAPPPPAGEPSPAAEAAPPAAPVESAAPAGAPPAAATAPVRPVNRKFLLTHNSPVFATASNTATTVAQVHRGKFVHVTGITGDWLRIQMRNGTVGFIPVNAAE